MLEPVKMETKFEAPVRADFAGGFSDIPHYLLKYGAKRGEVFNMALPLKVEARVWINSDDKEITLNLPDIHETVCGTLEDIGEEGEREKNNASMLTHRFVQFFDLNPKGLTIDLTTSGLIPPASGLGTSAAVGVALIRALADLYALAGINPCEFNYYTEQAMGVCGGKQDPYGAYLGGANYLWFNGPDMSLVDVRKHWEEGSEQYRWLLDHTLIYYSGQAHHSGVTNSKPEQIVASDPDILNRIARMAEVANDAVKNMDAGEMCRAINDDRAGRLYLMDGYYYTPKMWKLANVAESYGFAHRACGAGQGGCMLFFGDPERKADLVEELSKISGKVVC